MNPRPPVSIPVDRPIWERFYTVAPLVLVGTLEPDGTHDLAPKHLAMPVSFGNLFGFVCTERHRTWQNAVRTGCFTASYVRPDQAILASLGAAPRSGEDKPSLVAIPTSPAREVDGVVVDGAVVQLECRLERTVDELDGNGLVIGRVVAAAVAQDALREPDRDDADLLHEHPLMAFLYPDRFASIQRTHHFPFHAGWKR